MGVMQEALIFKKIVSPELLAQAHRLRFQVYCRECNFIDEAEYPGGYEMDEYDRYSVHFGALDAQERLVGAVRLILPACGKFPLEGKSPCIDLGGLGVSRDECAEISRLTISKAYRRGMQARPTEFILRVSSIALGLCLEMHRECRAMGINYCLALMEKPLWMLLRIHGFVFRQVGPEVDFFGKVTPYLIDIHDLEKRGLFKVSHGREIHFQKDQYS